MNLSNPRQKCHKRRVWNYAEKVFLKQIFNSHHYIDHNNRNVSSLYLMFNNKNINELCKAVQGLRLFYYQYTELADEDGHDS